MTLGSFESAPLVGVVAVLVVGAVLVGLALSLIKRVVGGVLVADGDRAGAAGGAAAGDQDGDAERRGGHAGATSMGKARWGMVERV